MKTRTIVTKLALTLCLAATLATASPAAHADGFSTPAGMSCEDAVLVRYHAGPRWSEVGTVIAAHLDFMRAQMRAGRILFGGPFYESGGLDIVRGADLAAAAALVENDPLVAQRVVTYSAERFWICRPAAERGGARAGR